MSLGGRRRRSCGGRVSSLGETYPQPLVDHAVARAPRLGGLPGTESRGGVGGPGGRVATNDEETHMTLSAETAARLAARIEGYRDEMVEFQCRLTAVTALGPENGGDGEWLRSRHLIEQLRAFGLDQIEEIDAPDPRVSTGLRPNLVVRMRGRRRRGRRYGCWHTWTRCRPERSSSGRATRSRRSCATGASSAGGWRTTSRASPPGCSPCGLCSTKASPRPPTWAWCW